VNEFLKRKKFEGIGVVRRLNYLRALNELKDAAGVFPFKEISKREIDLFLDRIGGKSANTLRIRFYCLKKFLEFIGRAKLLDGIKLPSKDEIKVKASDLLTREDLQKLVGACPTARSRAFIMSLYESGARIGEILNVQLRDVFFDGNGVLVEINGKTGKRRIRLVESARYLQEWMGELRKKHPKALYLWFGESDSEPSQYAATVKFLKQTARRAGLAKKVNPHLFRHSRASELAQKLREPQLRAFMGWGAASDMPQVYIHLSAQDMDKAILELYKTEDAKQATGTSLDEIANFFETYRKMKAIC